MKDKSCVFIGSAHPPNVDACNYLIEKIAPKLPDIDFHLVGTVCQQVDNKNSANIFLWGSLDEPQKLAVAKSAKIALNPVFNGGGSNVKIADYFSMGLRVLSTPFGARGFPSNVSAAIEVTELEDFATVLPRLIQIDSSEASTAHRLNIFDRYLNSINLGSALARYVTSLTVRRKRILYVTYRLTYPPRGGAEMHLFELIKHLANTGRYDIDIVAPDLDKIGEHSRFGGRYEADAITSGPAGIPYVRWTRFPLDEIEPKSANDDLMRIWQAQDSFERALLDDVDLSGTEPLLLWGWGGVEKNSEQEVRWAFADAAVFVPAPGVLVMRGHTHSPSTISSGHDSKTYFGPNYIDGSFELKFEVTTGVFSFKLTTSTSPGFDPRPLGVLMHSIVYEGVDICRSILETLSFEDADNKISVFEKAAAVSRHGCRLTDVRGPFSRELEGWINDHISEYDLLITHNNVFRPVVQSIDAAKLAGTPSILIPHAHLDDDYYHFPDLVASVGQATCVLAAPSLAVEHFKKYNSSVLIHVPGIDTLDVPSDADIKRFHAVYSNKSPFILILGRKASAKNYLWTIEAAQNCGIEVVLIGPDDDGFEIKRDGITYLNKQPRDVVRGALASCQFLVNMSSSESFGMVILEAWLSRKPVVVNSSCAAFQDLVRHGVDGFLVEKRDLSSIMRLLSDNEVLCRSVGDAGWSRVKHYDWSVIGEEFEGICQNVMNSSDPIEQ